MQARLTFILDRLNADLSTLGLGAVRVVDDPTPDWGADVAVFEFLGHRTSANPETVEEAVGLLAYTFQDDVIEEHRQAWPKVNGRALWASAASGVACWCLDDKPWCAIGQLAGALAAAEGEQPATEPEG